MSVLYRSIGLSSNKVYFLCGMWVLLHVVIILNKAFSHKQLRTYNSDSPVGLNVSAVLL